MPASELIERVSELIAAARDEVPPAIQADLDRIETRLREPLRVAVVGRVNAGKSTLVNALLGLRAAPTDVSECTRVVTWFRYGHPQRVTARLKAGGEIDVQLTVEGALPSALPVPTEDIEALDAYLANELLRSMTLVDTPGIGSVHGTLSASTEQLLATRTTARRRSLGRRRGVPAQPAGDGGRACDAAWLHRTRAAQSRRLRPGGRCRSPRPSRPAR